MKISNYFLLLFSILLLSCKDEDDQIPLSFLDGTYEWANENTETNIWYVNQYVFKTDGTFETFQYLRNSQDGPNLGMTYYSKGTYTLRGEEFTITLGESYGLDYEKFPEGYAASVEDLDQIDITQFSESKGTLNQLEGGERISILFECNDMLAMCMGAQEYVKVD